MNVFNAFNIARMSEAVLIDQFQDFDRIRSTSANSERVERAIEVMNKIAEELDRREG